METVNLITQLISTVGFPIVVCLLCFWFINKMQEQHKTDMKDIATQHKAEMDKMSEAINNNTLVMQKLIDRMDEN